MQTPVKIFVVYAHADKPVRDKLIRQLRPLAEKGEITLWSDDEIKPGALWDDEIRQRLAQSEIILLLVSDDFFASDYIRRVELPAVLERHARGETRLLPVITRHCGWADMPALSRLQVLPPEGRPVSSKEWDSPDEPYLKIYEGVKSAVRALRREAVNRTAAEAPVRPPVTIFRHWKPIVFSAVLILAVVAGVWKLIFHPVDANSPVSTPVSPGRDSIYPEAAEPDADTVTPKTKNIPVSETMKDKLDKPYNIIVSPRTRPSNQPLTDTTKSPETSMLPKDELEKLGLEHQLPPVDGMSRVINKKGQQGFMNVYTRKIIGWFEDTENFSKGRAYVRQNGRYFWIDKTGRCVDQCE